MRQYLTIYIPRTRVGFDLLDSGRGADNRMPKKREWDNYFIKYQALDKNISNFIFYWLEFSTILRETFHDKFSVSVFGQTAVYRIFTVSREPIRLPEIQHLVFGI